MLLYDVRQSVLIKPARSKAAIWQHFMVLASDHGTAVCLICNAQIQRGNSLSTTPLVTHVQYRHPEENRQLATELVNGSSMEDFYSPTRDSTFLETVLHWVVSSDSDGAAAAAAAAGDDDRDGDSDDNIDGDGSDSDGAAAAAAAAAAGDDDRDGEDDAGHDAADDDDGEDDADDDAVDDDTVVDDMSANSTADGHGGSRKRTRVE